MNYKLKFLPSALKEWQKLENTIQAKIKNGQQLNEGCKKPHH